MLDKEVFTRYLDLSPLNGRRAGRVLCPFHAEKTPSLSVDLDGGVFHCFGCGEQGGIVDFTRKLMEHGFIRAHAIGPRQPWTREPVQSYAEVQERIKAARRQVEALRKNAEDTPAGWARLASAADLERVVLAAEAEVDEAMG